MPTPEQLSAEKRKRVAEVCGWPNGFYPRDLATHWQALVSTVARELNKTPLEHRCYAPFITRNVRFINALATNNTPQIEGLAFELIEGGKDD